VANPENVTRKMIFNNNKEQVIHLLLMAHYQILLISTAKDSH